MGAVKAYNVSATFRKSSNRSLVKHMPSDLLFSFGAALFDKANKQTKIIRKEFYRKAVDDVLQCTAKLKKLEEQYYAAGR